MIDLSLNELKLVAKYNNIRECENKSKKDLKKILSEPKPKKKINKKKLEKIRKDFNEFMHKFSKEGMDKYRKCFLWYRKLQISFSTKNGRARKKSN